MLFETAMPLNYSTRTQFRGRYACRDCDCVHGQTAPPASGVELKRTVVLLCSMGKGAETRHAILERAATLATRTGLDGLSIGELAQDLGMSKSGLFAHFGSKESLQIGTLESAAARFTNTVVRPALAAAAGEPRIRAVIDHWVAWADAQGRKGCLFVQATAEFDDRPGPVREVLAAQQQRWLGFLQEAARRAVEEGHFDPSLDTEQFAFEVHALLLGFHHAHRMTRDSAAEGRLTRAVDRLFESCRPRIP